MIDLKISNHDLTPMVNDYWLNGTILLCSKCNAEIVYFKEEGASFYLQGYKTYKDLGILITCDETVIKYIIE